MRGILILAAVIVGIVLAYAVTHMALIEVGQEIAVLHKWRTDGTTSRARLWIVDDRGGTWLHHGYADSAWIRHLEAEPIVTVERNGESGQYRARPDPAADPKVHRLLREKYGFADRLVRFWAGTDGESGFATGAPCQAVPVRLTPL